MAKQAQCKDIPDRPILEFLARNPNKWHFWWPIDLPDRGTNPQLKDAEDRSVRHAMPPDVPGKLVLGKMRQLIHRGVVDGCPCGCRGDFTITGKGLAELEATK